MFTEIITTLTLLPAGNFPDIQPDYSAPFFASGLRIAAWVLGVIMIVLFIVLAACIVLIALRGSSPEKARSWAISNIGWVFLGVAAAGSLGGIFAWMLNFDLGF